VPRAELVVHRRAVEPDGSLVEIKIWQVPRNPRQPYGFKYSLVYIVGGKRLLGYDNAQGRDHKHLLDQDHPYHFVFPANLVTDFLRDLEKIREEKL
jgi:hypothetical protein